MTNSLKIALFLVATAALAPAGSVRATFEGEISDTQCAMNVHSLSHSHDEMIIKHTMGNDAASCAKACVKRGGEWVLRSGDEIYRLKQQSGIEEFAGQQVKIIGTLDKKTSTIDNAEITATAKKGNLN
jgi:hypothetical protein